MSFRRLIFGVVALVNVGGWVLPATGETTAESSRPNILYFFVDDMGWGSIGPNGQAARKAKGLPYVKTPNIDRLAAQGVNFQRAYACTVCSPSRSSQQSGFHQGHTFADRNDPDNAKKAMRADDVLMGDVLSAAGYATGYWGKWGYGGSKSQINPVIENVQTLPTSHGYQFVLAELHHVRAHTFFQPTLWKAPAATDAVGGLELVANSMAGYQRDERYANTPAFQNHADYPKTGYCDDMYAFAALDFVRTQAKNYNATGQPFFGLLAAQIPHGPFEEVSELPAWDAEYVDDAHFSKLSKQTQHWMAMVTRIDAHIGNILAVLEDPNQDGDHRDSVAKNTLVIFQSDNGGPAGKSNQELDSNGGLRGNKGKIYEGGIRVPLVMRWPAKLHADSLLKPNSNSDTVVDITDLLPTFCELASVSIPLGVDGVSIAPTLLGTGYQRKRDFVIHEAGRNQSIIRGKHKLVRSRSLLELYDLETDRAETNNIASQHPELVDELETLMLAERVAEPKGFAITYHDWTGENGDSSSAADRWSDYVYANNGITYMRDAGAPQGSWIARMFNQGTEPSTALVDTDIDVLAMGIRGNSEGQVPQTLLVENGVCLTGRNEIRIAAHGTLKLDQATVASQRWVEIEASGTLAGAGLVDCSIHCSGRLEVLSNSPLEVREDLHLNSLGVLRVTLAKPTKNAVLLIGGESHLAGALEIDTGSERKPVGSVLTLLRAKRILGAFSNADGEVIAAGGQRFQIRVSDSEVTVTAK